MSGRSKRIVGAASGTRGQGPIGNQYLDDGLRVLARIIAREIGHGVSEVLVQALATPKAKHSAENVGIRIPVDSTMRKPRAAVETGVR